MRLAGALRLLNSWRSQRLRGLGAFVLLAALTGCASPLLSPPQSTLDSRPVPAPEPAPPAATVQPEEASGLQPKPGRHLARAGAGAARGAADPRREGAVAGE